MRCRKGAPSSVPFFTTRRAPSCSATNQRPSGVCAIAVALSSPVTQPVSRLKPAGCVRVPPKRTVALAQAEVSPPAMRERARTTCWPEA
jgi:hypothetical protein